MKSRESNAPGSEDSDPGALSYAIAAYLPFLIVFLTTPLAIFFPNLIEFGFELSVIVPFLVWAILCFGGLTLLAFFGPRWRHRLLEAMFFVGFFLLLSSILSPIEWGLLDGDSLPAAPLRNSLIEFAIAVALSVCWFRLPTRYVIRFGVPLTLVLAASQFVVLGLGIAEWADHRKRLEDRPTNVTTMTPITAEFANRGNIYHIVLDGYSGLGFDDDVIKLGLDDQLDGFTIYERTLANYTRTDDSVPSFLVGNVFESGSIDEWRRSAKNGGVRQWLEQAGFAIEVYVPDRTRYWMYDNASHVRTSREISAEQFGGSDTFRLAHVTLVRVAPTVLRQAIYRFMDTTFRYNWYKRLSVPLVREFIEAEALRSSSGRYVYLHLILPHSPFVWDAQCAAVSEGSYEAQQICSLRLLGEIIESLKELGRYGNAAIIVQSDHGYHHFSKDSDLLDPASQVVKNRVNAAVGRGVGLDGYFRRIHPLLMIKTPRSDINAMQTSSLPVQLIDVPSTIADIAGIESPDTDGESVLGLSPTAHREIHLFLEIDRHGTQDHQIVSITTSQNPEFLHFSYTNGVGWRIYPNIPFNQE